MIDHVNAFALVAKDVKKLAEFYRDKLGFRLLELSDEFAYLKFSDEKGPGLAIVSREGFVKELAENSASNEINPGHGFYFASFLGNADKEAEELGRKGVHFATKPASRSDGQRYAFFEDPEGNMWEISHFPQ